MSGSDPTFAAWYPDADTGGTRYWDGSRWTGDARPPRKVFAAAGGDRTIGFSLAFLGAMFPSIGLMALFDKESDERVTTFLVTLVVGLVAGVAAVYWLRGQGPTTQAVERRLAEERKAAKKDRRAANVAGAAAQLGRILRPPSPAPQTSSDGAMAAQIDAIKDPGTARALQNLQSLLFTRTITDAEYAAAKVKLFGTEEPPDPFEQIEKLAELHRAGILGDVEFAAGKARALGI